MTEAQLQQQIVIFFRNNYQIKGIGIIFSVANEASYKNKNFQKTGVLNGVSDLLVLLREKTLFIELKSDKGKQSDAQLQFEKNVSNLGFKYYLVKSLEQFKEIIKNECTITF